MKSIAAVGLVLALGIGTASAQTATQMSTADCQSVWTRAGADNAGTLSQSAASGYVTNFTSADLDKDGKLTSAEFMSACQKGLVNSTASSGAGSGAPSGSSSTAPGTTKSTK